MTSASSISETPSLVEGASVEDAPFSVELKLGSVTVVVSVVLEVATVVVVEVLVVGAVLEEGVVVVVVVVDVV